jgi:hypothetical protein
MSAPIPQSSISARTFTCPNKCISTIKAFCNNFHYAKVQNIPMDPRWFQPNH